MILEIIYDIGYKSNIPEYLFLTGANCLLYKI